ADLGVDRVDVTESLGDIDAADEFVRGAERGAKSQSPVSAAVAVTFGGVESDARASPSTLPSEIRVVPVNLANQRRDELQRFDDEGIDAKHVRLLALALAKANPPAARSAGPLKDAKHRRRRRGRKPRP